MLHSVALVRNDVSEEHIAFIKVTRIGGLLSHTLLRLLVTANVVPSSLILFTLMMEAICSSNTSVLTRTTRSNITEKGIHHSHRRENLKSYKIAANFRVFKKRNVL
jgi:hypothetical protein